MKMNLLSRGGARNPSLRRLARGKRLHVVVAQATIAALIGPNGAGKTTLANVIVVPCPFSKGESSLMVLTSAGGLPQSRAKGFGAHVPNKSGLERQMSSRMSSLRRNTSLESRCLEYFFSPCGASRGTAEPDRAAELLNQFDLYHLRNEYGERHQWWPEAPTRIGTSLDGRAQTPAFGRADGRHRPVLNRPHFWAPSGCSAGWRNVLFN